MVGDPDVAAIEAAMVAMRRNQSRRALMKVALARQEPAPVDSSIFDVLDVIEAANQAGSPAGVREVALGLNVDQPRASKLVAAAVAAGYVRREADQADGRRTLLVATAVGHDTVERAHKFRRGIVEAATREWTAAERAQFAVLFDRFVSDVANVAAERSRGEIDSVNETD